MPTYHVDFDNGADITVDAARPGRNVIPLTSAQVNTTRKKFGDFSLDYRTVSQTGNAFQLVGPVTDFQFGAGQFTVEAWVWFVAHSATTAQVIAGNFSGSTNLGWNLQTTTAGALAFTYSLDGATSTAVSAAYTPTLGQWIHIAADRDASNVVRVYVNGAVHASATAAATLYPSSRAFYLGNDGNLNRVLPGNIGGFRVTKGLARYAGAFTPPDAAFPEDSAGDPNFALVTCLYNMTGPRDGLSFASRWRTLAYGATDARVEPGDIIKMMASPQPTLVGNATWNQNSKVVTLDAPVTQNISTCEVAWTAATNVSTSATTTNCKEGTRCAQMTLATAFTTGKIAHTATGTLDLSGYQQVSFHFSSSVSVAADVLTLRLCSDTAGNVAVHTLSIPAVLGNGRYPFVFDLGVPLGTIESVALYAAADPGTPSIYLDNILACKASSEPDALTLLSVIGKPHNLSWEPLTVYVVGDIRKPTQPNRNGFCYRVAARTAATGPNEPAWPEELGLTVTDGGVTWVCEDLEETWYPIQSINGTAVMIDNGTSTAYNAGRGYAGATETIATYKREGFKPPLPTGSTSVLCHVLAFGSVSNPVVYSGGWDRTDMSTMDGETWVDAQCGSGRIVQIGAAYTHVHNLSGVRGDYGFCEPGAGTVLKNSHMVGMTSNPLATLSTASDLTVTGAAWCNAVGAGVLAQVSVTLNIKRARIENNISSGCTVSPVTQYVAASLDTVKARNNGGYGLNLETRLLPKLSNIITGSNASGAVSTGTSLQLHNSVIPEINKVMNLPVRRNQYVGFNRLDQIEDKHLLVSDNGQIASATDQRHTESGISWKFSPQSASVRHRNYPLRMAVAKIACVADVPVSVSIWTYRNSADIKGMLRLAGGQIAGLPNDVTVPCEPEPNQWSLSPALTFTPTEKGVVEVVFDVWDEVSSTNSFWIDDLVIG